MSAAPIPLLQPIKMVAARTRAVLRTDRAQTCACFDHFYLWASLGITNGREYKNKVVEVLGEMKKPSCSNKTHSEWPVPLAQPSIAAKIRLREPPV